MSFPNLLNPTNDPQVAEQLSQTLSGIPEAALTVASAVPAAAKGGIDALMLAGMEPERRPMGIMVNGRWEPSVVGNVPMPLTAAVEQGMQDVMFTPRSQAGQEAVQGLGSFVDTLMEPATRATDAAIMAGIQRDLPSPAIALPLTFLTAALESLPTGRAQSATRAAARATDNIQMPDPVRPSTSTELSLEDLQQMMDPERQISTDPNVTQAAEALQAGGPLPERDPTLVDRDLLGADMRSDADVAFQMDQPIGSGIEKVSSHLSDYDDKVTSFFDGGRQRGSVTDTGGGQAVLGAQATRSSLLELAEQQPEVAARAFTPLQGSGKRNFANRTNQAQFSARLEDARTRMDPRDAAQVDPLPADFKGKLYQTDDGMAGFAITEDGTLTNLYRDPNAPFSGVMGAALTKARAEGAKNLEAFDTYLARGYMNRGAFETGRFPWDDEAAGPEIAAALGDRQPDFVQMGIGGVVPERRFSEALGDRGQAQPERFDPPRGVPDRVKDYFRGGRVSRLKRMAELGRQEGGDRWYWLGGLLDKFIDELGPELGTERFDLFMDLNAATSPRSPVAQQIKRASILYQRKVQGKDITNMQNAPSSQVGPTVAAENQFPSGTGALSNPIQMGIVKRLEETGRVGSTVDQPKIASFAENLKGNERPVTIDAHNLNIITGRDGSPNANEYAAMEAYQQNIAEQMGMEPSEFQAALWVGAKDITGVVDSTNMTPMINQRIAKTAEVLNIPEEEALVRFINGDTPLYSVMAGLFGVEIFRQISDEMEKADENET